MIKRVIGYVRVSTSKQEVGPEAQREALEVEDARQGRNHEIHQENAASARSLSDRLELTSARADPKAGRAEVMAVSKLNRLSRNVADFAGLLELSQRQSWVLVCLDLNVDTTTSTGAAMAQVTCTFAELESQRIGERTREGTATEKATGKHMGLRSVLPASTVRQVLTRVG